MSFRFVLSMYELCQVLFPHAIIAHLKLDLPIFR